MTVAESTSDTMHERQDTPDDIAFIPLKEAMAGIRLKGDAAKAGQLYDILRKMVVELRLLPNQILSEKEVALSLNVSKTPVREAFIRLAEDRVVRIVPHSGTYVAPIDVELAREGYVIWSALESSCAAKAAEVCRLDDAERLRDILVRIKARSAGGSEADFRVAAQELHNAIFELAGIPDAEKLVDATRFEVDRLRTIDRGRGQPPAGQAVEELGAVVNAIAAHNVEKARELMEGYLRRIGDVVASFGPGGEQEDTVRLLNARKPDSRRPRRQTKRRKTIKRAATRTRGNEGISA